MATHSTIQAVLVIICIYIESGRKTSPFMIKNRIFMINNLNIWV